MFSMDKHIDSINDVLDKFCFYLCTFIYAFKLTCVLLFCKYYMLINNLWEVQGSIKENENIVGFYSFLLGLIYFILTPSHPPQKKKETPITYHLITTVASQVSFSVNMHLGEKHTQRSCSQFQNYFHSTFLATFQNKCGKRWVDISSCIYWIRLAAYKTKPMWKAV